MMYDFAQFCITSCPYGLGLSPFSIPNNIASLRCKVATQDKCIYSQGEAMAHWIAHQAQCQTIRKQIWFLVHVGLCLSTLQVMDSVQGSVITA